MEIFTAFTKKTDGDMNIGVHRDSFLEKSGIQNKNPIIMNQKHGNNVCIVDDNYVSQDCDALVTARKDVILFVRVADCQPVLMWDSKKEVVAAVHAGREGTYKNIIIETINVMTEDFDCSAEDIKISIGPNAKKCCYEMGRDSDEPLDFVRDNFGDEFVINKNIDLNKILEQQLLKEGIQKDHIEISLDCTICKNDSYYSYRSTGEKKNFAGVIAMMQ